MKAKVGDVIRLCVPRFGSFYEVEEVTEYGALLRPLYKPFAAWDDIDMVVDRDAWNAKIESLND